MVGLVATLLEKVAQAARARAAADSDFRNVLVQARQVHSWSELANAAGMSAGSLRHHIREAQKGEK